MHQSGKLNNLCSNRNVKQLYLDNDVNYLFLFDCFLLFPCTLLSSKMGKTDEAEKEVEGLFTVKISNYSTTEK